MTRRTGLMVAVALTAWWAVWLWWWRPSLVALAVWWLAVLAALAVAVWLLAGVVAARSDEWADLARRDRRERDVKR